MHEVELNLRHVSIFNFSKDDRTGFPLLHGQLIHHIPLEYDDDTQGCIRLHI